MKRCEFVQADGGAAAAWPLGHARNRRVSGFWLRSWVPKVSHRHLEGSAYDRLCGAAAALRYMLAVGHYEPPLFFHGIDAAGQVVIRRQLKCRHVLVFFEKLPPCLISIEACASSHHWSRELQALGHTV